MQNKDGVQADICNEDDYRSHIKEFDFERSQARFEGFIIGIGRAITPDVDPTPYGQLNWTMTLDDCIRMRRELAILRLEKK